jgi:parallel beta-helix repeat protein
MNRTHILITLSAAALGTAGLLIAGPLNPPAGPVASTYKTLAEVEPRIAVSATNTPGDADSLFRISQPGSYYLTGNVAGVAAKHGIQISAHGVTLDLNGFEVRGVVGSLDGVNVATSDGLNITIKNGSLRSWGDCGVEAEYNAGHPPVCSLIGVDAASNGREGISLYFRSRVAACSAFENVADGFSLVGDAILLDCTAISNGDDGFSTNSGCTMSDCVATGNTTRGFYGASGCTYTNCSASNNGTGFSSQASIFTGCAAYSNTANGFDLFNSCTLTSCNAYRNGGIGIDASSSAVVTACTAAENTGIGINTSSNTAVSGCNASNNVGTGIQVTSNCVVKGNTAFNNGGVTVTFANIRATSSDNRIEGNQCTNAPIGIEMAIGGNIIIGNTCEGNTTNWIFAAGNYYGPIIDRAGVATAAVNGSAAVGTLTTSDSHANFSY